MTTRGITEPAGFYSREEQRQSRANLAAKHAQLGQGRLLETLSRVIRERATTEINTLLDFGGGNGATGLLLGRGVGARRVICYDIAEPNERAPGIEYLTGTWSDLEAQLGRDSVDVLLAEEVIEHVFDTDAMVQLCKRLLRPGGLLVLTTPNLSSAVNRLALLLGRQPGGTEVSTIFRPGEDSPSPLAGHIRVFTFGALQEFLRFHGFRVERAFTVPNLVDERGGLVNTHRLDELIDRIARRFSTSLSSRSIVVASSPRSVGDRANRPPTPVLLGRSILATQVRDGRGRQYALRPVAPNSDRVGDRGLRTGEDRPSSVASEDPKRSVPPYRGPSSCPLSSLGGQLRSPCRRV